MKFSPALTKVTPFSRILTGILFIGFPLIGFLLGMKYQQSIQKYPSHQTMLNVQPTSTQTQLQPPHVQTISNQDRMVGLYTRLNEEFHPADTMTSSLNEILTDEIIHITITEDYEGWPSLTDAERALLKIFDDKNTTIFSTPYWNIDVPIDLAGTIEYKTGSRGTFSIAGHRVGFQDNTGETWYFSWEDTTGRPIVKSGPCSTYMDDSLTDTMIIWGCNNAAFNVLDYEYAKDDKHVYFRPMPNANRSAVIVDEADPHTFVVSKNCTGIAKDSNNYYLFGEKFIETVNTQDPGTCF